MKSTVLSFLFGGFQTKVSFHRYGPLNPGVLMLPLKLVVIVGLITITRTQNTSKFLRMFAVDMQIPKRSPVRAISTGYKWCSITN